MLLEIPLSGAWSTHLEQRWTEAVEARLLSPGAMRSWKDARVFAPNETDRRALDASAPQQSLRLLLSQSPAEGAGWIPREDLIGEAASWLCATFAAIGGAWLFCEAGHSELGDKVLQQRSHVVHEGRPLLRTRITGTNSEDVGTVLRWGRSRRSLGVALSGQDSSLAFTPVERGWFICDAFDGDSLSVVPVGRG